jgi:hypothetical protein
MVNPPERRLSRGAVSDGCFVRKVVTESSAGSYSARRLIDFRLLGGAITVWARCKISDRVWSPDAITHMCAIIRAADIQVLVVCCNGGCVLDALGRTDLMVSVDQACTQPPPIVWSRCWRYLLTIE